METSVKDNTTVALFQPVLPTSDTCAVNITDTTVVSVADFPRENQPNGWLQLLVPVAVALFVVFLEKWLIIWCDRSKERKARKLYRNTVLDWIANILPSEKAFNQTVSILSSNISSSDEMQPVAYAMPLSLHDKLSDMSVEKMTEAFLSDFQKDKDERYVRMFNIISGFEFLTKMIEGVTQTYDNYNKQSFEQCREWNATYESFIDSYNAMPLHNPYQTIVEAWQMELVKKTDSRTVNLRYLEKLFITADKSKDYKTLSLINRMRRTVIQSQKISEGFAEIFLAMASNIELTINSLLESETFFRKDKGSESSNVIHTS